MSRNRHTQFETSLFIFVKFNLFIKLIGLFLLNLICFCCKRFATASTSMQVAELPWRYDAEMGTANSLHSSA